MDLVLSVNAKQLRPNFYCFYFFYLFSFRCLLDLWPVAFFCYGYIEINPQIETS